MTSDTMQAVLGWCSIINIVMLLLWFLLFVAAHNWIYRMHTRWFKITVEQFNAIHYAGIAFFKILILFFNIIPYFALRIAG